MKSSSRSSSRLRYALLSGLLVGLVGCGAHRSASQATPAKVGPPIPVPALPPSAAVADPSVVRSMVAVPVGAGDPSWGNPLAPVTIVEFSDFQCPFCARAARTIDALKRLYGPEQIRVVWKNDPLPFHGEARSAADTAMAVFRLGGAPAFWKFHDLVFAHQRELGPQGLRAWAEQAGVVGAKLEAALAAGEASAKVDEDMALGKRLDVRGTPIFRINGIVLMGAQPLPAFIEIIDPQLALAQQLRASGVAPSDLYVALSERNAAAEREAAEQAKDSRDAPETLWRVSVAESDPARGDGDALVTLVLFSDFECPFCKRMEDSVRVLQKKYGGDLRVVWKDYPLPFHRQALPAAILARVAQAERGASGFWQAHDALFDAQEGLGDDALKAIAGRLGLPWGDVASAIAGKRFAGLFDESRDLARALRIDGTPCSFINGVRVEGAVPVEALSAVIEEQLGRARALAAERGSRAGIYEALVEHGVDPDGIERKQVDPPTDENPMRGSATAKVTVQVFADFECPFCQRMDPTLAELEKRFSGRVRVVWRDYPLPFHKHAALAAEAAREVFLQKGAPAFWEFHDLLFTLPAKGGLDRPGLERSAQKVGVDMKRFRSALNGRTHRSAVEKDIAAAKKANIAGTPVVVINGYVVRGLRPLSVLERLVNRALAEDSPSGAP